MIIYAEALICHTGLWCGNKRVFVRSGVGNCRDSDGITVRRTSKDASTSSNKRCVLPNRPITGLEPADLQLLAA